MTKIYKKQESLEAYEQLTLRPDKLPSTSRQTVLDRALCSWQAVDHAACSRGFVSNGIANKLDGSEDDTLTLEVAEYWAELKMGGVHGLRAKVMAEVAKLVDEGIVSSFDDYKSILEEYDVHSPHLEGQEAFGQVIVDGDGEEVVDATEDDTGDTDRDDGDDDDDDGPSGGGDGLGGGGHEDLPPPAGEPHDGGSEPDYPPPVVPPRGPAHSGSAAAAAATPTASRHARLRAKAAAIVPSWTVTHPFKEEASRQISEGMNQQKLALETALQGMVTVGGDRPMEDILRRRLRDVVKKLHRSGDENRTCLRAIALERQAKVEVARAEHKSEEARTIELKLMVELRKNEAEIAKAKSKEASHAAKAALESAKKDRDEAARLRAKAEEDDQRLRVEFAAALVGQLDEYFRKGPIGDEKRARCQRIALNQARRRAGLQKIDVPRFWSPTTSGLVKLVGDGSNRRHAAKSEVKFSMQVRSSLGPCSAAGSSARKGGGVPKMNLDMPFVAWWSGRCLVILIFLEAGMALTTSWLSAATSWTWRLWLRIGGTPSWWGRSSTDAAWLSGHLWRLGGHPSYRRRRRPGRLRAKRRRPGRLRAQQLQAAQRS
jgi:hypothetical protein